MDQNTSMLDFRTDRFRRLGLLILRLGAGLYLAIGHGWPKIAGSVGEGGSVASVAETLGPGALALLFALVSVLLELLGGLLAALGFFTRTVSACLALYVTGAYLVGLGVGDLELTGMYGSVFFVLLLAGPGKYSVDEHLTARESPAYVVVNSTEMPAEEP